MERSDYTRSTRPTELDASNGADSGTKIMIKLKTVAIALLLLPVWVFAADYNIDRQQDGPFAFTISGVKINEGSSLIRESVLFNDPTCPVKIRSHTTGIIYKDRGFRFAARTSIDVESPIVALQVRTILYDVFGQHMHNLGNAEPKDFGLGQATISGEWRARERCERSSDDCHLRCSCSSGRRQSVDI